MISNPKTQSEDFYVNIQHAATSQRGFHAFLEDFLHLNLPLVRTSDGSERKLYLQIIFSAMFMNKNMAGLISCRECPYLAFESRKKRVVEYILGLDTFKNEKERDRLNGIKTDLEISGNSLSKKYSDVLIPNLAILLISPCIPVCFQTNSFAYCYSNS